MDRTDIGVEGPEFVFPVELGKVREFAAAVGCALDLVDPAPIVPPTFLTVSGRFWGYTFDDPRGTALAELDIDRSLLLHAEEEVTFHGAPIRAGETLRARTRIADVFEKEGRRGGAMLFVTAETTFRRPDGSLAATTRQTVVQTAQAAA